MPKAARLGDTASGHGCFPPTPIIAGSGDVSINGIPAARKGDAVLLHACPCPYVVHGVHPRSISAGSSTVTINGKPASRVGDAIGCGGSVSAGSGDVFIGDKTYRSSEHDCAEAAAAAQQPFMSIKPIVDGLGQQYNEAYFYHAMQKEMVREQILDQSIAAKRSEPQSIAEALEILKVRREQIQKSGYQSKYTDEELHHIVKNGDKYNDRFQVRLIFSDKESIVESTKDGLGFARESKRAPYWATTFDQMEAADSDPHLLAALFGITDYKPEQKFTLAIIDTENMPPKAERKTFIPTYDAMIEFGKNELARDFVKEKIFDPDIMSKIMTTAVSQDYKKAMEGFGKPSYLTDEFQDFIGNSNFDDDTKILLIARQKVDAEFGANTIFAGNGLTEVHKSCAWGEKINQTYGIAETFTFERDPLTFSDLVKDKNNPNSNKNSVYLINLNPINK